MKIRFFLGILAFVAVFVSSGIGIAIATLAKGRNISDVGVLIYNNSEMVLFSGGIIYLLVFEVAIWGMNKTIGRDTRFLHWFWLVPILLWTPVHFWLLLIFTAS
ncbi:MAG: hypothetical protein J7647_05435 [Cyanobacteria bacterium SBLK]|nr:hypothetical protein [Cyanobacteria bacterium SBLK]